MKHNNPRRVTLLWLRFLAVTFCLVYTVGVLGFFALRASLVSWPPGLALVNSFAPFLFVPLLLTLPLALLARSRVALISFLPVTGLFIALYGPFFLPRIRPAVASVDGTLTAMTFNLGLNRSTPEQLVAVIESEGADIVAVQEFTYATARLLHERLGTRYPYMVLDHNMSTSGLLSRYPILTQEWFQPAGEGRAALQVTLDVEGTPVHVIAVHPHPPALSWYKDTLLPTGLYDEGHKHQMADIVQRATALDGAVLVMGDFNMSDQTRAYAELSGVLEDAYREAGWGLGFTFPHGLQVGQIPVPGPLVRIDYIFHSNEFCARRARVACGSGSDHCYVVAQLAWVTPIGDQSQPILGERSGHAQDFVTALWYTL